MANKVDICGINTATLPKLKAKEIAELMKKQKAGDKEARQLFIFSNMRLVLSVVQRFTTKKDNVDDIFQVGCVGLIKAMENFDENFNVKFSTYAVPMIIGEIRRYLRDNSKIRVSRSLKDIAYKALQYKEKYYNEHGYEPKIEDIAKVLEVDTLDIIIAIEAVQEPISIFTPIFNNGGDEIYLIDQISDGDNSEQKRINLLMIEEGMNLLNDRLRSIIEARYYDNKTQMEIAEEIGISQAQVSRLEKSALKIIFGKD